MKRVAIIKTNILVTMQNSRTDCTTQVFVNLCKRRVVKQDVATVHEYGTQGRVDLGATFNGAASRNLLYVSTVQ